MAEWFKATVLKTVVAKATLGSNPSLSATPFPLKSRVQALEGLFLVSALRAPAWELAGELTDGGISWLCPVDFLLRVAVPALATGAARAGRSRPPLVAHVPVVARTDRAEVRAIARQQLAYYAAAPFYARMFADAGFPLRADGQVSDALVDDLVVSGTAEEIAAGVRARLGRGLDEVLVSVLTGPDRRADEAALVEAAAQV